MKRLQQAVKSQRYAIRMDLESNKKALRVLSFSFFSLSFELNKKMTYPPFKLEASLTSHEQDVVSTMFVAVSPRLTLCH